MISVNKYIINCTQHACQSLSVDLRVLFKLIPTLDILYQRLISSLWWKKFKVFASSDDEMTLVHCISLEKSQVAHSLIKGFFHKR